LTKYAKARKDMGLKGGSVAGMLLPGIRLVSRLEVE